MPADIQVEIVGMDKLQKAFKESPKIASKWLNTAVKQGIYTLLANARKAAPVDQGFLRNAGMVTSFEILKGLIENRAPYALYVHEGTRPHYVPMGAISGWAQRHGVPAYFVQRAILRKGTKARPFFKDSVEASQDDINKYFQDAVKNIVKDLAK